MIVDKTFFVGKVNNNRFLKVPSIEKYVWQVSVTVL